LAKDEIDAAQKKAIEIVDSAIPEDNTGNYFDPEGKIN
jgi:hypothetical protein